MWANREEIRKTYLDHLDSVRMSGLGHEHYQSEILSNMLQNMKEYDEAQEKPYTA